MFPIVRFDRKPLDAHLLTGFVIDYNKTLTLIQVYDTQCFQLNGWAVFLNTDVRKYNETPTNDLFARAAKLRKLKPAAPQGVSIDSWKDVLATAGAAYPLITIHRERIKRDSCWIGKLRKVTQRSVTIDSISPEAEWEDDESYLLRDITMVEFGGMYESILDRLASKRKGTGTLVRQ